MRSTPHISWFSDISLADRATVGGKGGSLGELMRAHIAVPSGFVVTTHGFEQLIAKLENENSIRSRAQALGEQDLEQTRALSEEVRQQFETAGLPESLCSDIVAAHAQLCGSDVSCPLAVRSSATAEDSEEASFAGQQDSYLWVRGPDAILKRIRSCWASLYSVPSISYRRKRAMSEEDVGIAVVVQKMVNARSAGVMFTRSPLTGDRSVITVEATWGLGSALVSGEVTPDRFVIGKITGQITAREISDKCIQHLPAENGGTKEVHTPEELHRVPAISDAELKNLAEIGRKVEQHYGKPQDIEWAIDHNGEIFLLQSRPETVWSSKDKPPIATPIDNPLLHVMNIFGGRR
jgi:pyruvate, water dikinase